VKVRLAATMAVAEAVATAEIAKSATWKVPVSFAPQVAPDCPVAPTVAVALAVTVVQRMFAWKVFVPRLQMHAGPAPLAPYAVSIPMTLSRAWVVIAEM